MPNGLFTPFRIGQLELRNRIIVSPMCQYSADEGRATDWHVIHLGHLALSGAALLTVEATAVEPDGRISVRDLGLWSDDTEAALARTLESVRQWSDIPIAIQLAHAGRKASTRVPWEGSTQVPPHGPAGGNRLHRRPSRSFPPTIRRLRSIATAFAASAKRLPRRHRVLAGWASMRCSSTAHMATSCTNSCRPCRTTATTNTGAASRIGCASRLKCSTRCEARSRPSGL